MFLPARQVYVLCIATHAHTHSISQFIHNKRATIFPQALSVYNRSATYICLSWIRLLESRSLRCNDSCQSNVDNIDYCRRISKHFGGVCCLVTLFARLHDGFCLFNTKTLTTANSRLTFRYSSLNYNRLRLKGSLMIQLYSCDRYI